MDAKVQLAEKFYLFRMLIRKLKTPFVFRTPKEAQSYGYRRLNHCCFELLR